MRKLIYALLFVVVLESPAHAYLDPGTGSMVLQALAGGVIAVALFWRRILSAVKGIVKTEKDD